MLPTAYSDSASSPPRVLRSIFRFRLVASVYPDAARLWKDFVGGSLISYINDQNRNATRKQECAFKVYFDGSYIRELELMIASVDDVRLAMGSCVGVVAYLIFHTRSLT